MRENLCNCIIEKKKKNTFPCVCARARDMCLALRARKSRDDSVLRAFRGKQWADPSQGVPHRKHSGPAAKLMSVPLMRFRRASTGQQIYDGAARSVILVNWSCGREMLTKSSQRKQLYRPDRFRRGSVALRTRESHWRVMGDRRRIMGAEGKLGWRPRILFTSFNPEAHRREIHMSSAAISYFILFHLISDQLTREL